MTAEKNIKNRIKRILINSLELNLKEDEIEESIKFDELFGLDSIAVIEFVLALEKEFEIIIDPDFLNIEVLKDLDKLTVFMETVIKNKSA